jgi:hypothetical protein
MAMERGWVMKTRLKKRMIILFMRNGARQQELKQKRLPKEPSLLIISKS